MSRKPSKRPWNEKAEIRAFWDTHSGMETQVVQTLKQTMKSHNGLKFEDGLRACMEGLAQVMDAIDELDKGNKSGVRKLYSPEDV